MGTAVVLLYLLVGVGALADREFENWRRFRYMADLEEVKLGSSKPMIATLVEMVEARVPIPYRDQCAHLLIPPNKCRSAEFFLPWKYENERHTYEKCEYEPVMERLLQMQKIREQEEKLKKKQPAGASLIPSTANA